MKNSLTLSLIVCTVLFGTACKKDKPDPAVAGLHIMLLSGDGQTDTTGSALTQDVVFLVTHDGHKPPHCYVRFETGDCENKILSAEWEIRNNPTVPIPDSAKVFYKWSLNAMVGTQRLKAILLDSTKQVQDSATVTATAVAPGKGWYHSGCAPLNTFTVSFCKLPSGRILSALHRVDYPYYSDDEGASWRPLTTLPDKFEINKLIGTPENEVFAGAAKVGVFYSNDGGATWQKRTNGLPLGYFEGDIYYTRSGKLFAFTTNGIFLSNDKGVNFHQVTFGLHAYAGFSDASSMSDGTILAIHDNQLIISKDGGEAWAPVNTLYSTHSKSLFIDDNDDVYVGAYSSPSTTDGLYVSKDKCQSFNKIYRANYEPSYDKLIDKISKSNGAYYFYATNANVLMKTTDFINYTTMIPPARERQGYNDGGYSYRYIVTDNGRCIASTELYGVWFNIP